MQLLSSIGRTVLSVLFPPRCAGCKKPGSTLCSQCAARLEPARGITAPWYSASYSYGDKLVRTVLTDL
ncbi:MAG TPA: double zinc ribbon domain-containing protein, partial [Candidatus Paceibacterota bacterium]|nr:double zinc ribbon domain-containing protein [Candidatus Paceibacterota bacterium]